MNYSIILSLLIMLGILYFFITLVNYLLKITTMGEPELIIGRNTGDWFSIIIGSLIIIITVNSFFGEISTNNHELYDVVSEIFSIIAAIEIFCNGILRKRIYELGILSNYYFISWEEITGYKFEGVWKDKLTLSTNKRVLLGKKIQITIPAEQKEVITTLLSTRVITKNTMPNPALQRTWPSAKR
jgi:hypothetical protein